MTTARDKPRVGAQQFPEQQRSHTNQAAFSAGERQGQPQQAAPTALAASDVAVWAVQQSQSGHPASSQGTGEQKTKGWLS